MKDCDACGKSQRLCDGYMANPNNPSACWHYGSDGVCKNKIFQTGFPVDRLMGSDEDPNGHPLTSIDVDVPDEGE